MPRDAEKRTYVSEGIEVTFEPKICIHVARCVMGLPDVFRPEDRPWVHLQNATADEIADIILTCPTGALEFRRLDGGSQEEPDEQSTIEPRPNGPLFVRGDLDIVDGGGNVVRHMTRAALCRCGGSENKPSAMVPTAASGFAPPDRTARLLQAGRRPQMRMRRYG